MREVNHSTRSLRLTVIFVTLCAMLVAVMMSRVYVLPLIFNDTAGYLGAARGDAWANAIRTPGYGWIMRLALFSGHPGLIIALQAGCWILAVALLATIVAARTRNVTATIVAGITPIFLELFLMHVLPAQWTLLSDPLYVTGIGGGILLMGLGIHAKRIRWVLLATLWMGLATLIRPIPMGLVTGIVGLIWATMMLASGWRRRTASILTGLILLAGPVSVPMLGNLAGAGSALPSSLLGLHLVMYADQLLQPDDRAFDDPVTNAQFHAVAASPVLLKQYDGADGFGMNPALSWHRLIKFYATLISDPPGAKRQFAIDTISRDVTLRLIRLHPLHYAELVMRECMTILIVTRSDRNYFWKSHPMDMYEILMLRGTLPKQFSRWLGGPIEVTQPFLNMDLRIKTILELPQHIINLPQRSHLSINLLAVYVIAMMAVFGCWLILRKGIPENLRLLGILILLCILNTTAHTVGQAMITLVDEPRFGLPGLFTLELAIAFVVAAVIGLIGKQRQNH